MLEGVCLWDARSVLDEIQEYIKPTRDPIIQEMSKHCHFGANAASIRVDIFGFRYHSVRVIICLAEFLTSHAIDSSAS